MNRIVWQVLVAAVLAAVLLPAWCCAAEVAPATRASLPLAEWRFQPGRPGAEPVAADWLLVRLPDLWTAAWLRTKAADGTSWAKQDLRDLNSAWYEADVPVPAEWQGRRVLLDLHGVQCDAVVWVDGRRIAEAPGPEPRVDLTGAAVPGGTARIRLWITRWWESTENRRERDVFRDLMVRYQARTPWYHSDDDVRKGTPGGISGGVVLLALPAAAEIENVVVRTSVRRKELSVTLDARLLTPAPGAQVRVQVSELGGATEGLPGGAAPLPDGPQPHSQTLTFPWANPRLWEVGAAHLYLLHASLVDAEGRVLDTYPPVRFGFREVWTEGRELMLNGHPLRLRMATFAQGVPQMLFYEGMGFNTITLQPNPTGWYGTWGYFPGDGMAGAGQALLDAADERGWAVLSPVPGASVARDALLAPEAQARYRRDLSIWLRMHDRQNRPSIVMWTPSMNTQGYPPPELLGRRPTTQQPAWFAKSEELIRSADTTRLIYHHQGGQTGDMETANLYLNWVPLAEQEEFLSAWSRGGEKPWAGVEHGAPLTWDFFRRGFVPCFTEYGAIYFGDAAYALEKDDYVRASLRALEETGAPRPWNGADRFLQAGDLARVGEWTAYYRVMDLFIRRVNTAWRAWGLNGGIFPWFFDVGFGAPPGYKPGNMGYMYEDLSGTPEELHRRPAWANPLYDAYRDTMQPLLIALAGPPARFTAREPRYTSGERAERSILAVWDGPGERSFTARWQVRVGREMVVAAGRRVAGGEETFRLSAGTNERRPLRFTVPPVKARTPATLSLAVTDAPGTLLKRDQTALVFFPPQPPAVRLAGRWGLYDPAGKTAAEWARAGLRARPIAAGGSVRGLDVLVVGAGALGRASGLPFAAADVARGLRVLVLEQGLAGLESLGFRVQDVVPRLVFPRVRTHAALAGLVPEDLRDWRGAGRLLPSASTGMRVWPWPHGPHIGNTGSVASVVIETPHKGAFTPLLECEFDLAYTPLLSWRHGRGEVLFSQLDLAGRLGSEPAAGRLARNLLSYLDRPPVGSQAREAIVLGAGPDAARFLGELGLRQRAAPAAKLPALSPAQSVVVVGTGAAAAAHRWELAAFVAAGGSVLFLPQDSAGLRAAGIPWPLPLEEVNAARVAPASLGDDPLLRGIGPQLAHWRTFVKGDVFPRQGLPPGARRLLDGRLLRVAAGKGQWIFCQVDWRKLEDSSHHLRRARWNTRKLYRQLLTNLGVATDGPVAGQMLAPRHFAPMVPVGTWQVLQQATPIAPDATPANAMPGLGVSLPAEAWLQSPDAARRREFVWRLRTADKNSYVDLTHVATAKLGLAGLAVTHVYSSVPRSATLAVSSDYWLVLRVNGQAVADQSKQGRAAGAPRPGELRLRVPLRAGWNRLEMKVASGNGGFGFWCQISDPGDLRVSPTVAAPTAVPGSSPPPAALRREPLVAGDFLLYAEALEKEDDPYGFTPW